MTLASSVAAMTEAALVVETTWAGYRAYAAHEATVALRCGGVEAVFTGLAHEGLNAIRPEPDWTEDDVWDYVKENDVPVHPLYAKGFKSLGCVPCSRPVKEGEHGRSGRWWWEVNAPKECGMHCSIETGGFEHEVEAIIGEAHANEQ